MACMKVSTYDCERAKIIEIASNSHLVENCRPRQSIAALSVRLELLTPFLRVNMHFYNATNQSTITNLLAFAGHIFKAFSPSARTDHQLTLAPFPFQLN